jgi:hypothetical protein
MKEVFEGDDFWVVSIEVDVIEFDGAGDGDVLGWDAEVAESVGVVWVLGGDAIDTVEGGVEDGFEFFVSAMAVLAEAGIDDGDGCALIFGGGDPVWPEFEFDEGEDGGIDAIDGAFDGPREIERCVAGDDVWEFLSSDIEAGFGGGGDDEFPVWVTAADSVDEGFEENDFSDAHGV